MAHDLLTVQRDPCAGVDALKLQPDLLRFSVISGGRKLRCIGAGAAPIIIATVLTIDVVPGMGQIHRSGFAVRPGELPVFISLVVLRIAPSCVVFYTISIVQECKFIRNRFAKSGTACAKFGFSPQKRPRRFVQSAQIRGACFVYSAFGGGSTILTANSAPRGSVDMVPLYLCTMRRATFSS